jgi:hypothetical protein
VKNSDLFRLVTKKDWNSLHVPSYQDILNRQEADLRSNYAATQLGVGTEELWITEEERENHLHILGTTGEGKSKFIEHLIRHDIQNGNGAILLDPSEMGEDKTCYNVLKYCCKIGYDKVILIDPHLLHSHKRLVCLQPFHSEKTYKTASVANILDTVRILFAAKDAAETPRIQRYMSAILNCLWNAEMTLHEAIYFTDYLNPTYKARRRYILSLSEEMDRHRLALEEVFTTRASFLNEFQSTIRRLEPFFDSTLDLMFGADEGLDFNKLIADKYVVLVNLYAGMGFEPLHTRLLGTTIINETIFALDRLRNRGWKGIFYLYIDEAGRYANRNLADLLAYKRKSGLRVTLAHQYFGQFEDKAILDAVKQLCKNKVMFNTPGYNDRMDMVKSLGYGNDIPPLLAAYANQDLPKQNMVAKIGKVAPRRLRVPDVPDAEVDDKVFEDFIAKTLAEHGTHIQDIKDQMERRFSEPVVAAPRRADNPSARPRAKDDRQPDSPGSVSRPKVPWKTHNKNQS